jgi:hypothetical protein
MEKYTKPVYSLEEAYLVSKGEYNPEYVEFIPVTFCEYGSCADLCVDYIMQENAPGKMFYYSENSIFGSPAYLTIGGSAQTTFSSMMFNLRRGVGGSASVKISSEISYGMTYTGSGLLKTSGAAPCIFPEIIEYEDQIISQEFAEIITTQGMGLNAGLMEVTYIDYLSSDIPLLSSPNSIVNPNKCACKNLPYQVSLNTNLNTSSNLTRFAQRNAIAFNPTFGLSYNFSGEYFSTSHSYNSQYEFEKWQIIITLSCDSQLSNFGTDPTWVLKMLIRQTQNNGQKYDTSIEIWVPGAQLCPTLAGSVINFNLSINTTTLLAIANNATTLPNVFINDGALVFASPAWNRNPVLNISGSVGS